MSEFTRAQTRRVIKRIAETGMSREPDEDREKPIKQQTAKKI
jgi:hypothetical protein